MNIDRTFKQSIKPQSFQEKLLFPALNPEKSIAAKKAHKIGLTILAIIFSLAAPVIMIPVIINIAKSYGQYKQQIIEKIKISQNEVLPVVPNPVVNNQEPGPVSPEKSPLSFEESYQHFLKRLMEDVDASSYDVNLYKDIFNSLTESSLENAIYHLLGRIPKEKRRENLTLITNFAKIANDDDLLSLIDEIPENNRVEFLQELDEIVEGNGFLFDSEILSLLKLVKEEERKDVAINLAKFFDQNIGDEPENFDENWSYEKIQSPKIKEFFLQLKEAKIEHKIEVAIKYFN